MKKVILLKATPTEESEDSFEVIISKENFQAQTIKTLDFEFKNLLVLRDCLKTPAKYSGIIFTSPRCVISVQNALNGEKLNNDWQSKKNYGVGPKTVKCSQEILKLECSGAEAGNANNLGDIIHHDIPDIKLPFLYPKGALAKDTLKQKLGNGSTEDIIVYDTVTSSTFESDLSTATNNFQDTIDYLVFFSPSGVKATMPYINKLSNNKLKVIAIGPTTEASLKEVSIQVSGTPSEPSATSLAILLKQLEDNQ